MQVCYPSASLALIGLENNSGCSGVFYKVLLVIAAPVDVLICVCVFVFHIFKGAVETWEDLL